MISFSNRGQAATEFIVAAVFVLVPLFLIVPLVGKYIDIRQALIQQARYEAWEYTVWYGPEEKVMSGTKSEQRAAAKKWRKTREEGIYFHFSDPRKKSSSSLYGTVTPNPLWVDHRGDSLFNIRGVNLEGAQKEGETPDRSPFGSFNIALKVIDTLLSAYGSLVQSLDKDAGKFDAIYTKGFFHTNPSIEVRSIDMILPEMTLAGAKKTPAAEPLRMEARASVISNYWNSGSTDQAIKESKGLVFSGILSPLSNVLNGTFEFVQRGINFAEKILPVDIKLPFFPKFGYVKKDLVPYEHLYKQDGDGDEEEVAELKSKAGLHYYKEK